MERQRWLGPYEILGLLGQGGMARVWAARHRQRGELRAIKVLSLSTPELRERFSREARLQARVSHANVLPLLDVLQLAEGPALVLPYVQGPTLAALLQRGRLPHPLVLALFHEVLQGVAAIHRAGLVHRDLKPNNVLLDTQGSLLRVLVADFGLARVVADAGLTQTGAVLGTPAYMSPEQRRGERLDARSDIWALGVLLLEMLTGERDPDQVELPPLCQALLRQDPAQRPDITQLLAGGPGDADLAALLEPCRALTPSLPQGETLLGKLPAERDSFVGREAELALLSEKLSSGVRLVTVLGAGGIGKTRLVLRYAGTCLDQWPGGIWFCDLCEARDVQEFAAAVARTLEVPLEGGSEQMGRAIDGRGRCLMVLDNFEQLAEVARGQLERWVGRAPEACWVVTSRQRLYLAGEEVLSLGPLPVEQGEELLRRRAAVQHPDWAGPDDEPVVTELVRLLDGLPLAIELAAARAALMSPRAQLSRLHDRFRLLASPQGRPSRHKTLRATLDWSWAMLSADEQRALAQLSVFEGGFSVEAIEEVLQLEELWPPDALQGLMDRSLVHRVSEDRFGMLVSVQEYAAEKLADDRLPAEQRHGAHYAQRGSPEALEAIDRHGGVARWYALAAEQGNLVATVRRAVARGDAVVAGRAALAAWRVLSRRGLLEPALQLLQQVLALPSLPRSNRGELCLRLALTAVHSGKSSVRDGALEQALVIARETGDPRLEAGVLTEQGTVLQDRGRTSEALAHYEQALTTSRAVGERKLQAYVLALTGAALGSSGRLHEGLPLLQEALALDLESGDRVHEGITRGLLAPLLLWSGQVEPARQAFEAALAIHREVGDARREGVVLGNLGALEAQLGRLQEAMDITEAAVRAGQQVGNLRSVAICTGNLGSMALKLGQLAQARACYELSLAQTRELGQSAQEGRLLGLLSEVSLREGDSAGAHQRYREAEALLSGLEDPIALGKLLCWRVSLDLSRGDTASAQAAAEEVAALVAQMGLGPEAELPVMLAQARALLL